MNHWRGQRVCLAGRMFRRCKADETKLGWDETIFGCCEDIRKRVVGTNALTKRRAETAHDRGS
jgi:hypothetical protein